MNLVDQPVNHCKKQGSFIWKMAVKAHGFDAKLSPEPSHCKCYQPLAVDDRNRCLYDLCASKRSPLHSCAFAVPMFARAFSVLHTRCSWSRAHSWGGLDGLLRPQRALPDGPSSGRAARRPGREDYYPPGPAEALVLTAGSIPCTVHSVTTPYLVRLCLVGVRSIRLLRDGSSAPHAG